MTCPDHDLEVTFLALNSRGEKVWRCPGLPRLGNGYGNYPHQFTERTAPEPPKKRRKAVAR